MTNMYENKVILLTGGTGSWGNELTEQLLKFNPKEIRIFSRGEFAQVTMERKFNNSKLTFIIGDVSDLESLEPAVVGVDYIFHLAALKHVPICERQPYEAIKTNVLGTENVVKMAIKYNVKKVIDVSTDKAVDPLNVYGTTKALGEKIIINANAKTKTTEFVCVRGGNVIGTNGSVIPFWRKQILENNKVTITDENMTRYFLTLTEAIQMLLKAAEISERGEIIVMKMPSLILKDLKIVMIKELSKGKNIEEETIGSRLGEKMDEVLVSKDEAGRTYCLDKNYYLIAPYNMNAKEKEKYKTMKRIEHEFTSANAHIMNHEEIIKLLKKENWI
jgi:UDP-N-acetylglucosamine 4,6-dehydratase/5-epimerase